MSGRALTLLGCLVLASIVSGQTPADTLAPAVDTLGFSPALLGATRDSSRGDRQRKRREDYVDTLGVGFFRKILAPVYPNPERAAAMSFVVPGAGQVYNRRFWYLKVPVIYAGGAWLIYRGESNRKLRNEYQEAYTLALQGLPHQFDDRPGATPRALQLQRDRYDKNFQLSYIGLVVLHLVQTLEAYTAAHLLEFDIDESLTLTPTLLQPPTLAGPSGATGGFAKPGIRLRVALNR